ncbi:hypothetical protein B0188_03335 [[Haemophilus] felis]|uniref:Type I restriction modification DNA specificity domain-containing protein n=1 Tax=[Haemophilus] felis TaxID=123822 RepID=A0A1T0B754_9PAST|nr:hypothetical protein B0188_03335 [[Haemophilus] felis]
MDSDYFLKKYLKIKTIVENNPDNFTSLSKLELKIDASAFYPSLEPYYNKGNIPFVRVSDVNNFIDYDNCIKIPKEIVNSNEFSTLKIISKGDIVITKGGSIGRVSLIEKETAVTRDLIFINSSRLSEMDYICLYVYFNTRFCHDLMVQSSSMTAQPHLTLTLVKKIPIFNPSNEFKDKVSALFKSSIYKREQAKTTYLLAEALLLEKLGLQHFQVPEQAVNLKSFSASFGLSGRLDAEFYQAKYESYKTKIEANGFVKIQDEYSQVKTKSNFDLPNYQYIEIGDVNVSEGSYLFNEIATEELPANAKIMVKKGDILISTVRPNRGAITIIEHERNDLIVSGAFTVLRKKMKSKFNNEFLKVLLRTEMYKDWLLQFNVGTSYPVIKDEDVLNLVIPKVNEETQTKIAQLIQQSNRLREESKALLEEAKYRVELAIEQGESAALALS